MHQGYHHCTLIISPLRALMAHQYKRFKAAGLPCAWVHEGMTQRDKQRAWLIIGCKQLVNIFCFSRSYRGVQCSLGITRNHAGGFLENQNPGVENLIAGFWRGTLYSRMVNECLKMNWKYNCFLPRGDKFRPLYAEVGVLRSLVSADCRLVLLTATLSDEAKNTIFSCCHFSEGDVAIIQRLPDR
jgi:hypothetical protein